MQCSCAADHQLHSPGFCKQLKSDRSPSDRQSATGPLARQLHRSNFPIGHRKHCKSQVNHSRGARSEKHGVGHKVALPAPNCYANQANQALLPAYTLSNLWMNLFCLVEVCPLFAIIFRLSFQYVRKCPRSRPTRSVVIPRYLSTCGRSAVYRAIKLQFIHCSAPIRTTFRVCRGGAGLAATLATDAEQTSVTAWRSMVLIQTNTNMQNSKLNKRSTILNLTKPN